MAKRAINVREGVKGERCRVLGVPDGRCFGAGHAGRDGGCCTGIEWGDDSCGREAGIDGGGDGKAQVAEGPAANGSSDRRGVGVKEIVHPMQCSVCRLAVDQRDVRALKALDELVDGGGRHGWGLTN